MWHKQSFTQFWSQSDAYSRRSSLKLTYIHHPLVVCTHQICCAVAVPIALSQDRLLHGHNRLVNWTPCSRMRESKLKSNCEVSTLPFVIILQQFVWEIKCEIWSNLSQIIKDLLYPPNNIHQRTNELWSVLSHWWVDKPSDKMLEVAYLYTVSVMLERLRGLHHHVIT